MAYKQTRPLNMKGPLKRSGLKLGRVRNAEIKNQIGQELSGDTDSTFYYNSNMGPMKMMTPSALKQMEEEMPVEGEEMPVEGEEMMGTEGMGGPQVGGEEDDENIDLLPSENPDTWVYPGEIISERIADYEDRISFIKEDIFNQDDVPTPRQTEDMQILESELAELRKEQ